MDDDTQIDALRKRRVNAEQNIAVLQRMHDGSQNEGWRKRYLAGIAEWKAVLAQIDIAIGQVTTQPAEGQ